MFKLHFLKRKLNVDWY